MRKGIWQTGEFWVADGRWITIRLKSRRLADRSMSVGRQPGKPGWLATVVNVTGGTVYIHEITFIHIIPDLRTVFISIDQPPILGNAVWNLGLLNIIMNYPRILSLNFMTLRDITNQFWETIYLILNT